MSYRHTDDMGEISGFGGGYEACCQDMLEAGVNWLTNYAGGKPELRMLTHPQVYGVLIADNEATKELETVVLAAANGEATGAMHHAVMSRLGWIAMNGWDAYCLEMRKEPTDEV